MLLVIDIGNTNIVLGVFHGDDLLHSWRIATDRGRTIDEYAVLCRNLFTWSSVNSGEFESVLISSVVPPLDACFSQLSRDYFGVSPAFVLPEKQTFLPILYQPVADVGADRIVAALAALELSLPPIIVVDFGTATTFDAISAQGEYLGGVIAPGIGISSEALFARASKLPRIEVRRPGRVIGRSTVASMQSGLYYGYVSLVEGLLRRISKELGPAHVIATGGFARSIARDLPMIDRVEENLMLYGLKLYHDKLKQSGGASEG